MNPTTIQNNDHKIVRFTNVTNFDFTAEMGAMFGGVPYFVAAGKSMLMPMTVGDHLATHLARQIIIQKAPIRDDKETDGKGSVHKLWDDKAIDSIKAKIVVQVSEEAAPVVQGEAARLAQKVQELNKDFPPEANVNVPSETNVNSGYKDKAEVIAELVKRNIKYDARKSKATLEVLLK